MSTWLILIMYKLSTEYHWNKALLTIETLDLHKWNQNEFRICSHTHRRGGKCSYQVFVHQVTWRAIYTQLFLQHLTHLNVSEAETVEQQNLFIIKWLVDDSWAIHFISVITQQCLHTVGQSLHFNNIRATTPWSCLSSINMYIKHHLSHNHSVLTDSVFPWSCFGVCRLVFSRCCWHRLGLLEGIVGKSLPQRTWRDISGEKSA